MARILFAAVGVLAFGTTVAGVTACRDRGPVAQDGQAHAEYFCPMHPQIVRDRPGDCPVCGMKLEKRAKHVATPTPPAERRVLFYRHPMDPSIRSDRPSKDDMGMDYVPVYADKA